MKNYVHDGETLTLVLTEDVRSGRPVMVGEVFGIAVGDGKAGDKLAVTIVGVYELTKLAGAIGQGERVFWQKAQVAPPKDEGITKTADGNRLVGVAAKSAGSGDLTVEVRLNGAF